MSLCTSSRRLVRSTISLTSSPSPLAVLLSPACSQRRTILGWNPVGRWAMRSSKQNQEEKKAPPAKDPVRDIIKSKANPATPVFGSLSKDSIFQDEEIAGPEITEDEKTKTLVRDKKNMAAALDPDPDNRRRWERKMVIREIRKRGRLTRKQELKQKERESLSKSHDFRTSTKKLMFLARQIAGKPVDEAITQMRFSVKKAAKEVKYHLEHARNEAIVRRGMGLGKVNGTTGPAVNIQTKDGKRLKIEDRTRLYVDQAWVGKGAHGKTPDFRARHRIYMMKNPSTSITVVLKEEATRVRLHEEREEKLKNKRVWTQLPNRPITAQRQYYSW